MDKPRQPQLIALLLLLLSSPALAGHSSQLDKRLQQHGDHGNDYGPPLQLTSSVLQLLPAAHAGSLELSHEPEHPQVHLLLPLYGNGDSNSVYSHDHAYWPHIYTLDSQQHSLLPLLPAKAREPEAGLVVSDNLDFKHNLNELKLALAQQQLQHHAKSYGR